MTCWMRNAAVMNKRSKNTARRDGHVDSPPRTHFTRVCCQKDRVCSHTRLVNLIEVVKASYSGDLMLSILRRNCKITPDPISNRSLMALRPTSKRFQKRRWSKQTRPASGFCGEASYVNFRIDFHSTVFTQYKTSPVSGWNWRHLQVLRRSVALRSMATAGVLAPDQRQDYTEEQNLNESPPGWTLGAKCNCRDYP
jgi:hypothetical protein